MLFRSCGIRLSFNEPIDPATLDAGQFAVSAWNYKRTSGYGSKKYKPSQPDVVGTDTWPVGRVSRTDDPRAVWIELPAIMPTHQVRVDYRVGFESGATLADSVHLTIHALKDR